MAFILLILISYNKQNKAKYKKTIFPNYLYSIKSKNITTVNTDPEAILNKVNATSGYTELKSAHNQKSNNNISAFKLNMVDTLLRLSNQYPKWKYLCQNNGVDANRAANSILKRNSLLKEAESGKIIDWENFDKLTKHIESFGIFLYRKNELIDLNIVPETANTRPSTKNYDNLHTNYKSPVNNTNRFNALNLEQTIAKKPIKKISNVFLGPNKNNLNNKIIPFPIKSELPSKDILSEDNLLIFDVQYDKKILNQGITGYGNQTNILLPLSEIANTLDFNIKVYPEKGLAKGWYISENRSFFIDAFNKTCKINDKTQVFPKDSIKVYDDDIYINNKVLGKLFPVDFNVIFSDLVIDIKPREKLPFQEKFDREQKRGILAKNHFTNDPKLPFSSYKHNFFSTPFVDVNLESSTTHNSDNRNKTRYSIISNGDLAYMTSDIYLSGDDKDSIDNVNFKLTKNDQNLLKLGPLHAKSISLGDIKPINFPILGEHPVERGILVNNTDTNKSHEFDTTSFQGTLPPGWEIEVYQNNNLITSKVVGPDGQYDIDNIQVYYGKNNFSLISYGPQGQKKIEKKTIIIGDGLLTKGEGKYQLSLTEKGKKTFNTNNPYKDEDQGSARLSAQYEHGVSNNFSIGTGVVSTEINNNRHNYFNIGIRGKKAGAFAKADIVKDIKSGDSTQFVVQKALGPVNIRAKHTQYSNFIDENSINNKDTMISASDISAQGVLSEKGFFSNIPFSVSLSKINNENSHLTRLSNRMAAVLNNIYLSNNINADFDSDQSEARITSAFQTTAHFSPMRIRGNIEYDIKPTFKAKSVEISDFWPINKSISTLFEIKNNFDDNKKTTGTLNLNWDAGKVTVSPRISYDSEGEYTGYVSMNFSLGRDPYSGNINLSSKAQANNGAVSAMVFQDKNINNIFDNGDTPLENIEVKATQVGRKALTNEKGFAFLTHLPKYHKTDIEVNTDTLKNPYDDLSFKGNSIAPPPGSVHSLQFPVVTTGEVDGTVYIQNPDDGTRKKLSNTKLQLLDSSGKEIQTVKSEFDGFYLFMKVPPGYYFIKVSPDNQFNENFKVPVKRVKIGADGTVLSGIDLTLTSCFPRNDKAYLKSSELTSKASYNLPNQEHDFDKPYQSGKGVYIYKNDAWINDSHSISAKDKLLYENAAWVNKNKTNKNNQTHNNLNDNNNNKTVIYKNDAWADNSQPITSNDKLLYENAAWVNKNKTNKNNQTHNNLNDNNNKTVIYKNDAWADNSGIKNKGSKNRYGIHLASYRSRAKAIDGIKHVQNINNNLFGKDNYSIKRVDLGQDKGIWYRVIAGSFNNKNDAEKLSVKLLNHHNYAAIINIDKNKLVS